MTGLQTVSKFADRHSKPEQHESGASMQFWPCCRQMGRHVPLAHSSPTAQQTPLQQVVWSQQSHVSLQLPPGGRQHVALLKSHAAWQWVAPPLWQHWLSSSQSRCRVKHPVQTLSSGSQNPSQQSPSVSHGSSGSAQQRSAMHSWRLKKFWQQSALVSQLPCV
jgi:hypothetical protein